MFVTISAKVADWVTVQSAPPAQLCFGPQLFRQEHDWDVFLEDLFAGVAGCSSEGVASLRHGGWFLSRWRPKIIPYRAAYIL